MGLDMYLYADKYVGNWNHTDEAEKREYRHVAAAAGIDDNDLKHLEGQQTIELRLTVAYWRKANAIHRWFVEKCQNGVDECKSTDVSREQLTQLLELCKTTLQTLETVPGDVHEGRTYYPDGRVQEHIREGEIVAQQGIAAAKLPTQGGFFFGSTDYDEYYVQNLQDTVNQLESVLNNPKFNDWTFSYQSSW